MRKTLVLLALASFVLAAPASAPASAKAWTTDYAHSSIAFSGKQNDEAFTGHFKKFETAIDFDPANPTAGKITADIDVTSALTGSTDIDSYLPQGDWFDSPKFPKANFTSTSIAAAKEPSCYDVKGNLGLKGVSKPVSVHFCLTPEGDAMHAKGQAQLSRMDFGIGSGQWSDDATVAHAVTVTLDIVAK